MYLLLTQCLWIKEIIWKFTEHIPAKICEWFIKVEVLLQFKFRTAFWCRAHAVDCGVNSEMLFSIEFMLLIVV